MITAIILAAGQSRRMGRLKQLLPLAGKPLLQHAIDNARASNVDEVLLVLGHGTATIRQSLDLTDVLVVENPHYLDGMHTSLYAGIRALPPDCEAFVMLLGDQPYVLPAYIDAVIGTFRREGGPIVAAFYRGERGHPVLFARPLFEEMLAKLGEGGARRLIAAHAAEVQRAEIAAPRPDVDVDTPQDYERLVSGASDEGI